MKKENEICDYGSVRREVIIVKTQTGAARHTSSPSIRILLFGSLSNIPFLILYNF